MSSLLSELSQRASQLTPEEKAILAEELLGSLQTWSSPEVEAAWDGEILRRINAYELGEATLVPATEVFEQARRLTQ
jgi:putative addiction module component (TIGR02574 family)